MIAIIVAMQKELHLLLGRMGHDVELLQIDSHTYYAGRLAGHDIVATTCGIGKVNAALGTEALIRNFKPTLVINTGVAGGVGAEGVKVLDVVFGTEVAYHDVWCGPGTEWGEAAGCPARFTSDTSMLPDNAFDGIERLHKGLIASGDIFVSRAEDVAAIRSHYPQAIAVDMESAAVMHTCHRLSVPAMVLRVISDTPGAADNITQYENFWDDAPRESMDALAHLLGAMPQSTPPQQ